MAPFEGGGLREAYLGSVQGWVHMIGIWERLLVVKGMSVRKIINVKKEPWEGHVSSFTYQG